MRNHVVHAKKLAAEQAVKLYGLPVDIDAAVALQDEVNRTVGAITWLTLELQALDTAALVQGVTKTIINPDGSRVVISEAVESIWLKLLKDERRHLVQVAKATCDVGVANRIADITETQAARLATIIESIVGGLGRSMDEPAVREVVRLGLSQAAS